MNTLEERVKSAKRTIRSHSVDGIERRYAPFTWVQARDGGAKLDSFDVVGHAAVFDDLSENLGFYFDEWYERIEPGAFATVLKGSPDVRALYNHDPNLVLARTKSGTLSLAEDDTGLAYRATVPEGLYYGDALRILMDRGDVDQSSFAFRVARKGDSWEEQEDGSLVRTIHQFSELYDVSPVTYPAYPTTDSGVASSDKDEAATRKDPSPDDERIGDEPAGQRTDDGDGTGSADGTTEGMTRDQARRLLETKRERLAR